MTKPPIYKGVGGNLVDFAIAGSYELGYQGRMQKTLPMERSAVEGKFQAISAPVELVLKTKN